MIFGKIKSLKSQLAAAHQRIEKLRSEKEELKARVKDLKKLSRAFPGLDPDQLSDIGYSADGLCVWGKNPSFLKDEQFQKAYQVAVNSGHQFANQDNFHIEWRVHVVLWAARQALKLEGDFVECGVNTGIFALAIANYCNFASVDKKFFLFDTYCGTPEEQMSESEREKCVKDNQLYYPDCYELAKNNFAPYPNLLPIRGRVPEVLPSQDIGKVAYLSIDMNVAAAESAALEYFWDKLVPGAPVVLDDYAWKSCELQHESHNEFARSRNVPILTLPTGQGLIIKPEN